MCVGLAAVLAGCSPNPLVADAAALAADAEIGEDSASGNLDQTGDIADSSDGAMVVDVDVGEVDLGDTADTAAPGDSGEVDAGDGGAWDVQQVDADGGGDVEAPSDVDATDGGVPLPDATTAEICAALEPLCGVGCSSPQDWQANPPILTYKNELSDILGPKNFGFSPFYRSLWVPAQLEPSQPGHVLLRASWFNNVARYWHF